MVSFSTSNSISLLDKFSTWNKLLRISAIWMHFINWLRHRHYLNTSKPINGPLQVDELESAQKAWVRYTQLQCFSVEINKVSNGNIITKGPLKQLSPFMDYGIIRVGCRLEHSKELYFHKHPTVLLYKYRAYFSSISFTVNVYGSSRVAFEYLVTILAIERT